MRRDLPPRARKEEISEAEADVQASGQLQGRVHVSAATVSRLTTRALLAPHRRLGDQQRQSEQQTEPANDREHEAGAYAEFRGALRVDEKGGRGAGQHAAAA